MSLQQIAIQRTGLVTSVGLSAPAACAAIRSKLTNPTETRFVDAAGEWITVHQVPLELPLRGLAKLTRMAAMVGEECLEDIASEHWTRIPLLLCVAEPERPGRLEGIEERLFIDMQQMLGARFSEDSELIAHGRVGVAVALDKARRLIFGRGIPCVLIVAVDSLLSWPTLSHYEQNARLLTSENSNGFIAGEGAAALLVGPPGDGPSLSCSGLGFGVEQSHVESDEPLRAEGLSQAIKNALADAGREMHELDFRIPDVSGEQYYFKEAALALSRTLRRRKDAFDIWHPAECCGEAGALSGGVLFVVAEAACRKGYAPGANILVHMASDAGQRAAAVLSFGAR